MDKKLVEFLNVIFWRVDKVETVYPEFIPHLRRLQHYR